MNLSNCANAGADMFGTALVTVDPALGPLGLAAGAGGPEWDGIDVFEILCAWDAAMKG